jgi:LPS O-antigen subunit length determinant protein (WzzB/FepE family)
MQLSLLERINPQSEEIPFLKAEVSTIQERLPSLAKGGSRRESVEKEPETVAGVRIQLARLQTHLDRLNDKEQPLLEIVDRAIVPTEPNNSPRAVLILALAGIVGFFVSIFLVFLIDFIQKMREQHLAKES